MTFTIDVQDSVKDKFLWLLNHFNGEVQIHTTSDESDSTSGKIQELSIEDFEQEYIR